MPIDLDAIPDAVPRTEPLHRFANRPYAVLGREYVPATSLRPYRERGIASWYGRKFHGQKTSIGEIYDMYAMTAAHPTLPLPSYARVTSVATGKSVVVRVNDRGPFLHGRVIDLSYAAAHRLGIAQKGSGEVEVEAILPGATTLRRGRAAAPGRAGRRERPARRPARRRSRPMPAAADAEAGLRRAARRVREPRQCAEVSSRTCRTSWRRPQVEPRVRQAAGCSASMSVPIAKRDDARRAAARIARRSGSDVGSATERLGRLRRVHDLRAARTPGAI